MKNKRRTPPSGVDQIKRKQTLLLEILLLISLLILTAGISHAADPGTLTVKSRCSCLHSTDYEWHQVTWINYCPMCHHYGALYLEFDPNYPEGIIVCSHCDADYCGVHGTEHSTPARAYLTRAKPAEKAHLSQFKLIFNIMKQTIGGLRK